MLDSEEETLEEHVVLLLVGELVGTLRLVGLHQVAKLVLCEGLLVCAESLHDLNERGSEARLCLFVILGVSWSFQKVHDEVSRSFDWDLSIGLEVEE